MSTRRKILFTDLNQVTEEAESLLASGYSMAGRWTLGQICSHMRTTIQANMDGFPKWMLVVGYPLRPILHWLVLPQFLKGNSPKGIKTAGMFVPPDHLNNAEEVQRLKQCVSQFLDASQPVHAHPGFGKMNKGEFEKFHAAHASHHLGFLTPNTPE